jgi:hypothetical protein
VKVRATERKQKFFMLDFGKLANSGRRPFSTKWEDPIIWRRLPDFGALHHEQRASIPAYKFSISCPPDDVALLHPCYKHNHRWMPGYFNRHHVVEHVQRESSDVGLHRRRGRR